MRDAVRRPGWMSACLVVGTAMLGVLVRFGHFGLPWPVRKYGGSVLWAVMVYWLASTVLRRVRPPVVALVAEAVAAGVEFFKRVHSPGLERLRGTLAGILLLGREFSYADIVAYTAAIGGVVLVDMWLRERLGARPRLRA